METEAFRKAFLNWIESIKSLLPNEVISIDGKTLRRSHDKANGKEAIQMVRRHLK